jgi:hypothetical protein
MIEGGGNICMAYFIRARLAQVKYALIAGVKPISEAFKRRPLSLHEAYNIAVKIPQLIQQLTRSPKVVMVEAGRTHAFARIIARLPSL